MFGSHSVGSLKTHLWHLSDATFPINLFKISPIQEIYFLKIILSSPTRFSHSTKSHTYPPFSIIIELNGHFAESFSDRIFSINVWKTICNSPSAKPIFPHQHPSPNSIFKKKLNTKKIYITSNNDQKYQIPIYQCHFRSQITLN